MSTLIRVEDRQEFGQGHRSRAIALLQAFIREKKEAYIVTDNLAWLELLQLQGLPVIQLQNTEDITSELHEILEVAVKMNSVKIILDGEKFDESYCKLLIESNISVILINDLPRNVIRSASCIVNPNVYATKALYPSPWPEIFYGGREYILLRESFLKPKVPKKADGGILITLGVSANAGLIAMLEKLFVDLGLKCIIATDLNEKQMVEAIDNASIVICGASVTLHEVWARSRYAIPIYQAKDQEYFWKYLTSLNIQVIDGLGKPPISIVTSVKNIVKTIGAETGLKFIDIENQGATRLINEIYKDN